MFYFYRYLSKYKSILCFYIFFIAFTSFSYAENTKEELEKKQIANEVFNKYQSIAKSLNISQPNEIGRDASKIIVTSSFASYKIRYLPTAILDITLDYNKKTKKFTTISINSRLLDTPEKITAYKNNFYIFSKLIDPSINSTSFEKIYSNIDIKKASSESKYLRSYINNGFLFEIDAYSRKTQIFTLKIREKNKTDDDKISMTKDLTNLYSKVLTKLSIYKLPLIYPEFSIISIKTKKAFFFTSSNISMDLLLEMNFRNIKPISGTIVYENQINIPSKETDFMESALILIALTNNKLSKQQINDVLSNLNIKEAITKKDYYKEITTQDMVYTIGYDKNKLYLASNIKDAKYDKKAKLEALTRQLYNTVASDFQLLDKVKLLENQDLSTSLLSSQNTVVFTVNQFLTFRIYFDNSTDSISRINLIMPRDMLDRYSEVQKNNALIATKLMNPNITYSEAEGIYNYLKNSYGVTETSIINDLRYKRCTYKDETLVFSKFDQKNTSENKSTSLTNSNSNPNLIYAPDEIVNKDGKKVLIVKPEPLCY